MIGGIDDGYSWAEKDSHPNVSSTQVAEFLGCSTRHALTLLAEGKIPAIDIGAGGELRYRTTRKNLLRYAEQVKVDPGLL